MNYVDERLVTSLTDDFVAQLGGGPATESGPALSAEYAPKVAADVATSGSAAAAGSSSSLVLSTACPGASRAVDAIVITVTIPMTPHALPAPTPSASSSASSSGTCTVRVRAVGTAHSVAQIVLAAAQASKQCHPASSRMDTRFAVMLPDCDSATGAVSAASIRLREPAMQLPLTRLHEQAATAHPASVLARVAGIARHRGLLSCNLCPDGFAAAPPSEAGSGALRVVSYNLLCPAKFSSSEGAFRGGGCACERDAGPANWNPRLQLQARALATSGAHIICLQELATDEQALHVSFASNLPDYDVAAATIRRHDEDMVAILLRKPGTLGSSEPTEPILAVETSPDTGAPLVLSCHASERRAVCSIAIVKASYATGSFRVCIAAAHFRFVKPQSGAAEQERTRASKLAEATYFKHRAFEYAAKHGLDASRGDIVVFTGDLNMESAKPDGDARDRPVWEALSTPLMPDPAPGSDGGALVSALAVAEAGSAAGAGSGCFVSHVTRQGHQRGADFILLGAPVDGATCARGDPKRGLPRHPADRVAHASVMPYCMLPTARIPYPAVDGVFRIGEDALGRHWHKPNEMPEGVWAQLSDHRPILADILPPSGSLRPTA